MKNKAILSAVILLLSSLTVAQTNEGVQLLLSQLYFQKGQQNLTQVGAILSKLEKTNYKDAQVVEEQIVYYIQTEQFELAQQTIFRNRPLLSATKHSQLKHLIHVYQHQKPLLDEARFLTLRRLYKQALEIYSDLMVSDDIHYSLKLEYWDVLTEVYPEKRTEVTEQLAQLNNEYPTNIYLTISYLKYKIRLTPEQTTIYQQLDQQAANTVWQNEVLRIWKIGLMRVPVNQQFIPWFRKYIEWDNTDNEVVTKYSEGVAAIRKHQRLLKLPEYRAKLQVVELVRDGASIEKIEPLMKLALSKFATDEELKVAYARFLMRKGEHKQAQEIFAECISKNFNQRGACESLLNTASYWGKVQAFNLALKAQDIAEAQRLLIELEQDPENSDYLYILRANLHIALQEYQDAEWQYQQLLQIDDVNKSALSGLVSLISNTQGYEKLVVWYESLSGDQQQIIAEEVFKQQLTEQRAKASELVEAGKIQQAKSVLEQFINEAKNKNIPATWLRYDLANLNVSEGNNQQALKLFDLVQVDEELVYATNLILTKLAAWQEIINNITELGSSSSRIQEQQIQAEFQLAKSTLGDNPTDLRLTELEALVTNHPLYWSDLADVYLQYDRLEKAQYWLQRAATDNRDVDSKLDLAYLFYEKQQYANAANYINDIQANLSLDEAQTLRVLVLTGQLIKAGYLSNNTWKDIEQQLMRIPAQGQGYQYWALMLDVAEHNNNVMQQWTARQALTKIVSNPHYLWSQLLKMIEADLPVSRTTYLNQVLIPFLNKYPLDPNGYDVAERYFVSLEQYSNKQLVHKGLTASLIQIRLESMFGVMQQDIQKQSLLNIIKQPHHSVNDREELQRLFTQFEQGELVNESSDVDHWMFNRFKRSIAAKEKYQPRLEFSFQLDTKSGASGISEYRQQITHFGYHKDFADSTFGKGEWFIAADKLEIDSGSLFDNPSSSPNIGSSPACLPNCELLEIESKQKGYNYFIGARNDDFEMDFGVVANGFDRSDWVGGISWRTSIKDIGVTLGVSKRPVTGSLISLAGRQDPYGDKTMGGAKIQTLSSTFSYNPGSGWGIWSVADLGVIKGSQMQDNTRLRIMAGYYHNLYRSSLLNVNVGANILTWSYDKNQSQYTLGHGGYYSPQHYKGLSLPLNLYGRYRSWSYQVYLSASISHSGYDAELYYPTMPEYQPQLSYNASNGSGTGYYLEGIVEYKIDKHWQIGARASFQRSEFYEPNNFYIYLRYLFEPSYSLVNSPPKPVINYLSY